MPLIINIGAFSVEIILAYLWSLTSITQFTPQLLALLIIIAILSFKIHRQLFLHLTSFIFTLVIFTTGGVISPAFFLSYFIIFLLGFQYPFPLTLSYSLVLIIVLSQSLNSFSSFLPLCSLLLIPPFIWFINLLEITLQKEETDFNLWSSLNLRSGLTEISDTANCLNSTNLNPDQHRLVKVIIKSTFSLLSSLDKLKKDLN